VEVCVLPLLGNPPPISSSGAGKDLCIMSDGPYKGTVGELLRDKEGKPRFLRMQHRIFPRSNETI
jgi:hypothetical protein